MVLMTHHTQSSYAVVPLRPFSWNKGIRLKSTGIQFQIVSRIDRCLALKHPFCRSPVPCNVREVKGKPLQITSFQRNIQNNEGGDSSSKLIVPKSSVKISILPQDRDASLVNFPTSHEIPVSCAFESNTTLSGSQAIRGLFKKGLNLLHTGTPSETETNILEETPQEDDPQEQKVANTRKGEILEVVLCYFLGLDATINIPIMTFIPLYLAVNVVYGAEVSRELTPLWVIGPLIVALYVKLFRWMVALYIKVVKTLPLYYSVVYKYIIEGKLKEEIEAQLWQPVANLRRVDYMELSMRKWKVFQVWLMEKYLDCLESIWPYYCRTIRFLKRAHFL